MIPVIKRLSLNKKTSYSHSRRFNREWNPFKRDGLEHPNEVIQEKS